MSLRSRLHSTGPSKEPAAPISTADEFPVPLGQRPAWLQILECFAHELDRDALLAWAYEVKHTNNSQAAAELGFRLVRHGRSKLIAYAREQARIHKPQETGPMLSPENRKTFVIGVLGYDPTKPRKERPCFTPPNPSVDISDFPDGITNPWAQLTKP
jgi:hypothetical protein